MELWHYTSLSALRSILSTKELWFTDFACTNDSTDGDWARRVLQDYFTRELFDSVKDEVEFKQLSTSKLKDIVDEETQVRLNIIFKKAFCDRDDPETDFRSFIFSLCAVSAENPNDGLLSMWRGYSALDPIALVFDKDNLINQIITSDDKYKAWVHGNAIYARTINDIPADEYTHLEKLRPLLRQKYFKDTSTEIMRSALEAVTELGTRIKHKGFKEEHEYRIGFITLNPRKKYKNQDQINELLKYRIEAENGIDRLKIPLGATLKTILKKVVIGPSPDQVEIEKQLKVLRNRFGFFKIIKSEIPFVGRK